MIRVEDALFTDSAIEIHLVNDRAVSFSFMQLVEKHLNPHVFFFPFVFCPCLHMKLLKNKVLCIPVKVPLTVPILLSATNLRAFLKRGAVKSLNMASTGKSS